MQHSTHLSLVLQAGTTVSAYRRLARVGSYGVHAGAAQRFIGSSEHDANGDEPVRSTAAVHRRSNGTHYATHDGVAAIAAGDPIQGAAQGKIGKWAPVALAIAMPAAGATAVTAAHDLSVDPENGIQVQVVIPALPALADTKIGTFVLQDSADNVTFAAISSLDSFTRTGAGGVGAAALTRTFNLPANVRRYVRLSATVEAAGGNNTGVSASLNLLLPKIGQAEEAATDDGHVIRVTFDK